MSLIAGQPYIRFRAAFNTRFGSGAQVFPTDLTNRVHTRWTCKRGQQYERSQAAAGTLTVNMRNDDGYLDPSNSSSPFYPGVDLYRPIWVDAQYPATQNMLTGDQATSGEATPLSPGAIPASLDMATSITGATLSIAASASAWQGTQVFQAAMPASAASGSAIIKFQHIPVQATSPTAPPTVYTWSTYVRCATSGVNPLVAALVTWFTVSGTAVSSTTGTTATLTGSTTGGWVRVQVTGTPPAGAVYCNLDVVTEGTTPAVTWTYQQDGAQFEMNGLATGWVQPGTWYPIWAGAINADPRVSGGDAAFDKSGNYSVAQISATDVLGCLAQAKLNDCYINTLIQQYGPNFVYPLSDPAFPAGVAQQYNDWTGTRTPGAIFFSTPLAGTLQSGQSIGGSWNSPYASGFYGTNGPVVSFSNAEAFFTNFTPTENVWVSTGINLGTGAGGAVGPPPNSAWTRLVGFQMGPQTNTLYSPGAPYNGSTLLRQVVWAAVGPSPSGFPQISLSAYQPVTWSSGAETLGTPYVLFEAWTGGGTYISQQIFVNNSPTRIDNNYWHLLAISLSADGKTFTINIGSQATNTTYNFSVSTGGVDFRTTSSTAYQTDSVAAWYAPWVTWSNTYPPANPAGPVQYGMNGQIGPVAELPYAITTAQFADLWQSFQTAYSGDTTGARAQRIAAWGGYLGTLRVDAGAQSMGAAGGLGSANGPWNGAPALSALQPVVFLEQGMTFAGADGAFVFHSASYRTSQSTPAVIFGESPPKGAAGEVPYIAFQPGFDGVEVINIAQFNMSSGVAGSAAIPVSAVNQTSRNSYYPQSVQQTVNPLSPSQAQTLANNLVSGDGVPRDRIASLRVQPTHTPNIWPQILGLDLDTLVRVNRRPLRQPPITVNAFTESVAWEVDPSVPSAIVTYQGTSSGLVAP